MSAELTMHTILAAGVALVGGRIFEDTWPATDAAGAATTFPLVVYQRVPTGEMIQPVTGAVIATDARFQVKAYAQTAGEARDVADQIVTALVAGIGTVVDVTMMGRWGTYEPDSELFSLLVECRLLIAGAA